jgi:hypothetical protein
VPAFFSLVMIELGRSIANGRDFLLRQLCVLQGEASPFFSPRRFKFLPQKLLLLTVFPHFSFGKVGDGGDSTSSDSTSGNIND